MKRFTRIGNASLCAFRETLGWAFDVLGLGFGIGCVIVVVIGVPERAPREQRSVATEFGQYEDGQHLRDETDQSALVVSPIPDSIVSYENGRE